MITLDEIRKSLDEPLPDNAVHAGMFTAKRDKYIKWLLSQVDELTKAFHDALTALSAIREYQETVGSSMGKHGTVWKLANEYLEGILQDEMLDKAIANYESTVDRPKD